MTALRAGVFFSLSLSWSLMSFHPPSTPSLTHKPLPVLVPHVQTHTLPKNTKHESAAWHPSGLLRFSGYCSDLIYFWAPRHICFAFRYQSMSVCVEGPFQMFDSTACVHFVPHEWGEVVFWSRHPGSGLHVATFFFSLFPPVSPTFHMAWHELVRN